MTTARVAGAAARAAAFAAARAARTAAFALAHAVEQPPAVEQTAAVEQAAELAVNLAADILARVVAAGNRRGVVRPSRVGVDRRDEPRDCMELGARRSSLARRQDQAQRQAKPERHPSPISGTHSYSLLCSINPSWIVYGLGKASGGRARAFLLREVHAIDRAQARPCHRSSARGPKILERIRPLWRADKTGRRDRASSTPHRTIPP